VQSAEITERGGLASFLERLIPSWAAREDSEHEQAVLRLLVGGTAALYLAYLQLRSGSAFTLANPTLLTVTLFFVLTTAIFCWLFVSPAVSVPRRLLGAATDLGMTSVAIYLNGNLATPMFCIYLWVTFGNGFRYGRKYLYFSMLLSVVGFSLVLLFSPNWTLPYHVSLALLLGLIILPLYVSALLGRLTGALKESEKASLAKSNFLSIMSHEIRTPLSGIVGVISLLKQCELGEEQSRYLKIIEDSANRLSQLLSDSLDYSKIEAGELIIENRPFFLREAIDEAAAKYRELATALDLDFICLANGKLPKAVIGDRDRLKQVLDNLLSNSFKFTESGTIILKAVPSSLTRQHAIINFSVSDTGIGIPAGLSETIFKPFRQVDASMRRKREGSGLGLTITAKLVELFGGNLEVVSEEGKGSIFRFELELPLAEPHEAEILERDDGGRPSWLREPRILLIEDNTTNQEVICNLLETLGCATDTAFNGRLGCEKLTDGSYDLVFMDCQMPVMDGYEATRRIRADKTGPNREIPIVALTAHVTAADRKMCSDAGMSDYQGKPCGLADLQLILKKWLPELLAADTSQPDAPAAAQAPRTPAPEAPEGKAPDAPPENNRKHIHDLRNSYTKIMGCAELIMLGRLPPEKVAQHLSLICDEVRKANAITRKIS